MKYRSSEKPTKKKKVKKPGAAEIESPASAVDDDIVEDNHVLTIDELPTHTQSLSNVAQREIPKSAFPDIQPWFIPAGEWRGVLSDTGTRIYDVELDFGTFIWAWSLIEQRARALLDYAMRPGIDDEFWESTSSVVLRATDAFRAEAAKHPELHRPLPEKGKKPVVAMPKTKTPAKKAAKEPNAKKGRRRYKTKP